MSASNAEARQTSASNPSGSERRTRLQGTIDSLIALRRDVVASYCRLAGIGSFEERETARLKIVAEELVPFCETMVDYTAMGHFEIYQRIIEGKERRRAIQETAADVYPAIAETTDWLVDFNDRHESFEGSEEQVEVAAAALPKLGDIIAIRSQLEDQLLDALRR